MRRLLSDITVLETGDGVAIRYLGHLFSEFGARVIRPEPADSAHIGYAGHCGEVYGRWLDQGKSPGPVGAGERIDLVIGGQDSAGVARARALSEKTAGAMLLALTWFDPEGPYGAWTATDEIMAALNGAAYSFGEHDGPPCWLRGPRRRSPPAWSPSSPRSRACSKPPTVARSGSTSTSSRRRCATPRPAP